MLDSPFSWDMVCTPVPVDGMGFGIVSGNTVILSVGKKEVDARPQVGDAVEIVHGDFGDPRIYELWINGKQVR